MHQLLHQLRKVSIWLHKLRLRTHKTIRDTPHAPKESILKDPRRLIHPIRRLSSKIAQHRHDSAIYTQSP